MTRTMTRTMTRLVTGRLLMTMGLSSACVLTPPDPREPLRELRAQQRGQVDRLAATFCDRYYACRCDDPHPTHETQAECVDHIASVLLQHLEPGIDEELDYNPDCLDTNVALIGDLGCATFEVVAADEALERRLLEARRCRTYHGPKEQGDACTPLTGARGDACEPGLRCHEQFQGCLEPTPPAEEPACLDEGVRCDEGLRCDEGACVPQRALICDFESDLP